MPTDPTTSHPSRHPCFAELILLALIVPAATTVGCGDGWISVDERPNGADSPSQATSPTSEVSSDPSSTDGDTPQTTDPETDEERGFSPEPGRLRRLTKTQIENSLVDVFGTRLEVAEMLPADETVERFLSMGASKVGTSSRGAQQYRDAALEIADRVLTDHRDTVPVLDECRPETTDAPCIREVVEFLGTKLWRRPLTDAEIDRYASLIDKAGDDRVELGLQYVLAGLLQSPHFLYIDQPGKPAPDSTLYKFTDWEMASRLSFFLWNHPPDAELRDAARQGRLRTADQIGAQTRRMLDDDRARHLAYRFFSQAWDVANLNVGRHNAEEHPAWSKELVASMRREFRLVLEEIVFERDADIRDILTADFTYADQRLADLYDIDESNGDGFERVSLPDRRSGLLTSGAVIASHSNSKHFLPVHRGVFVLRRILCTDPPPPTDEAEEAAQETAEKVEENEGTMTPRQIMEQHASKPECSSCHEMFDPMGFTFSHYDRIGTYQETYDGEPIDATGSFDDASFEGVSDLAEYVRDDPRTGRCIARNLFQFATGQQLDGQDRPLVGQLAEHLRSEDHSLQALVVDITTSEPFRYAAPPGYQSTQ